MRSGRADYPETLVEGEARRSRPNSHSSTPRLWRGLRVTFKIGSKNH